MAPSERRFKAEVMSPWATMSMASAFLSYPPQLARLGDSSLKCVGQQFVVVGLAAFAQNQVWPTGGFLVDGPEPAAWKAHDEIPLLHLDNEVR